MFSVTRNLELSGFYTLRPMPRMRDRLSGASSWDLWDDYRSTVDGQQNFG